VEITVLSIPLTNPGYIKIGEEIISYTGTSGRALTRNCKRKLIIP